MSRQRKGSVYILRVTLANGDVLHKIGITTRSVDKRLIEIASDYMGKYGYLPMIEIMKKDRCRNYFGVESLLLKLSGHLKVDWLFKFDGSSEFRRLNEKFDFDWLHAEYRKAFDSIGYKENEIPPEIEPEVKKNVLDDMDRTNVLTDMAPVKIDYNQENDV